MLDSTSIDGGGGGGGGSEQARPVVSYFTSCARYLLKRWLQVRGWHSLSLSGLEEEEEEGIMTATPRKVRMYDASSTLSSRLEIRTWPSSDPFYAEKWVNQQQQKMYMCQEFGSYCL